MKKTVYEAFNIFLQEVVLNNSGNNKIFTCKNGEESINPDFESLYVMFTKKPQEGNQKFGDKIKNQKSNCK
ncbi:hypothetical protein LA02_994 [Francisella philomiragia]|uniref:hypothetical protein n=1 Tax=Francisella philomiragia TaxID=28110 RepID=UPI0005A56DDB|nr:hypothetical protein [Francisella philomiragia]AJI56367.1 hypothetical protein LA02_994 [Francisella philomiragia]